MMVAEARKPLRDRLDSPIFFDAQDLSTVALASFGDEEAPVREHDAVPWAVARSGGDDCPFPIRFDPKEPGSQKELAIGIARLDDVRTSLVVEGHAGRKSQTTSDGLDAKTSRQSDVLGPDLAASGKGCLAAPIGGMHRETAAEQQKRG
jgi:hypothetical protein